MVNTQGQGPKDYLIVGLGRFGSSLAIKLHELGCDVLAVDTDPKIIQEMSPMLPQVVTADASQLDSLAALGAEAFSTAIVCVGQDFESSVLTTLTLKHEFKVPKVIAKAISMRQRDVLLRVGADQVVLPEYESGVRLAYQLDSDVTVLERLELEAGLSVSCVPCPKFLLGKTLRDSELRAHYKVNLLMIKGARRLLHPDAGEVLQSGDILVLLGADHDISKLALTTARA